MANRAGNAGAIRRLAVGMVLFGLGCCLPVRAQDEALPTERSAEHAGPSVGMAPEEAILAVEMRLQSGRLRQAWEDLGRLREAYPEDLRLEGMQMEIEDVLLARAAAEEAAARAQSPIRLADARAKTRIAVTVLERQFGALAGRPEPERAEAARSLLEKLDGVVATNPPILEVSYLQAQLALMAGDPIRGRVAALSLAEMGLPRMAEASPAIRALDEALRQRGWYGSALAEPALERSGAGNGGAADPTEPGAAEKIRRMIESRE